jgi:D-glycero-D-manno-heptose 1,7-bisphosphate phosphatase
MAPVAPAQAVILCGGLGTRLGPLTARCPKPLLPVGGRPFLEILIFELVRQGVRRVLLLAAFEAGQVQDFARGLPERLPHPVQISVVSEAQPAGTSGALWQARDQLDERFLLLNGDSWFDILLADVATAQLARPGLLGALALRPVPDGSRYGCVQLSDGILTGFEERGAARGPALINGGVYCFDRGVLQYLVPDGSLERDVLPRLAMQGALAGIERSSFFIDIGVPDDFAAAQHLVPAQRCRPAVFLAGDGLVNSERAQLEWTAGVAAALRLANVSGWFAFVIAGKSDGRKCWLGAGCCLPLPEKLALDHDRFGAHIDDLILCTAGENRDSKISNESVCGISTQELVARFEKYWPTDLRRSVVVAKGNFDKDFFPKLGFNFIIEDRNDPDAILEGFFEKNRILNASSE